MCIILFCNTSLKISSATLQLVERYVFNLQGSGNAKPTAYIGDDLLFRGTKHAAGGSGDPP